MRVTAKEAKDRFGEVMSAAVRETVVITKYGRPETAMISAQRLEELERAEDAMWIARAEEAEKEGFLGVEESEAFVREILDAEA